MFTSGLSAGLAEWIINDLWYFSVTTSRPTLAPAQENNAPPRPDVGQPQRPQDVSKWGREGERYNPNAPAQGSTFQHKNNGVQLQPAMQQPVGVQPQQTYGISQPG